MQNIASLQSLQSSVRLNHIADLSLHLYIFLYIFRYKNCNSDEILMKSYMHIIRIENQEYKNFGYNNLKTNANRPIFLEHMLRY